MNKLNAEVENWINEIYKDIIKLLKIKKTLPLELFDSDKLYGYVASKSYIIKKIDCNDKTKKSKITQTRFKPYAIRIARDWVEVCHEHQNNHLLPLVVRTLIHEIVHWRSGKVRHSKKFYREYFKITLKYCAFKLGISVKETKKDRELVRYINEYKLS